MGDKFKDPNNQVSLASKTSFIAEVKYVTSIRSISTVFVKMLHNVNLLVSILTVTPHIVSNTSVYNILTHHNNTKLDKLRVAIMSSSTGSSDY